MVRIRKTLSIIANLILFLIWTTIIVAAAPPELRQKQDTENFVYDVQAGDTLLLIALRYNLSPIQIAVANNLSNPNLVFPGQKLILPRIEPLASPTEDLVPPEGKVHTVQPGESLSNIAGLYGVSVGHLLLLNHVSNPDIIEIGQTLQIPSGPPPTPGPLMLPFEDIGLSEPTIIQGRTLVVKVALSESATLTGLFEGYPVFFHSNNDGQFWGIVAIHALIRPDIYPIIITATLPNGREITRFENVTVIEGPYGTEHIQLDSTRSQLLDAELIRLEAETLRNLWSQVSLRPRWEGPFWYPVATDNLRITSNFGTRRQYNDSEELSFHDGTDFGGGIGTPIYAPAAGTVVLAERLTVRGNAVLIDHGLGLYSGYWHQSQIVVTEGQRVQQGDLIGYIGDSGLVTGPHLHWELRLNGIAVEPLQWIQQSIP